MSPSRLIMTGTGERTSRSGGPETACGTSSRQRVVIRALSRLNGAQGAWGIFPFRLTMTATGERTSRSGGQETGYGTSARLRVSTKASSRSSGEPVHMTMFPWRLTTMETDVPIWRCGVRALGPGTSAGRQAGTPPPTLCSGGPRSGRTYRCEGASHGRPPPQAHGRTPAPGKPVVVEARERLAGRMGRWAEMHLALGIC